MDVENLNRTQIILLTLLISFVTSIATGIVTVSLLQQAPPGITQTINRVVEHTVEKIVPTAGSSVVTKETTVVVKEDDLVTKSVQKDASGIVSVSQKGINTDGSPSLSFVGWGTVLTNTGIIATDSGIISDTGNYSITTLDGKTLDTKVLNQDEVLGIALLQALAPDTKYSFTPVTLGDADKLQLGQSIIVFGGEKGRTISLGVVSSLALIDQNAGGTTTPDQIVGYIDISPAPLAIGRGGPLSNLFGEVIGMNTGEKQDRFISENLLQQKLAALPK
jgi:putative serine protease PepD